MPVRSKKHRDMGCEYHDNYLEVLIEYPQSFASSKMIPSLCHQGGRGEQPNYFPYPNEIYPTEHF